MNEENLKSIPDVVSVIVEKAMTLSGGLDGPLRGVERMAVAWFGSEAK